MPTVRVNDVGLYYETYGSGPALVLIAGLNSDHTLFRSFIPRLAERYQVIVFDNRGLYGITAICGPPAAERTIRSARRSASLPARARGAHLSYRRATTESASALDVHGSMGARR
jgi:pimeloyl-ACP methyl ester carboxylesterase